VSVQWSQWHSLPSRTRIEITEEIISDTTRFVAHKALLFARELADAGSVTTPGEALAAFGGMLQEQDAETLRFAIDSFSYNQSPAD
jgi:hypothetical protein